MWSFLNVLLSTVDTTPEHSKANLSHGNLIQTVIAGESMRSIMCDRSPRVLSLVVIFTACVEVIHNLGTPLPY